MKTKGWFKLKTAMSHRKLEIYLRTTQMRLTVINITKVWALARLLHNPGPRVRGTPSAHRRPHGSGVQKLVGRIRQLLAEPPLRMAAFRSEIMMAN